MIARIAIIEKLAQSGDPVIGRAARLLSFRSAPFQLDSQAVYALTGGRKTWFLRFA